MMAVFSIVGFSSSTTFDPLTIETGESPLMVAGGLFARRVERAFDISARPIAFGLLGAWIVTDDPVVKALTFVLLVLVLIIDFFAIAVRKASGLGDPSATPLRADKVGFPLEPL